MAYPEAYHKAMGMLIRRNEAPETRLQVARTLRMYRNARNTEGLADFQNAASRIGWPIRKRPNGRFT